MNKLLNIILPFFALLIFHVSQAEVRLPQMIRDGMVLQRGIPIPIWGWASPNEEIRVIFNKKITDTKADQDGKWLVRLPSMKAGGPYEMVVEGENKIILKNVLIGDVWFCSGQSNMVHQLKLHNIRYQEEIEKANFSEIRQFWIPTLANLEGPREDLPAGEWKAANPKNVLDFSAVAYFFAKRLYEKYHVPIGIVNASVGGTPIEAWISKQGFKEFPGILNTLDKNEDTAYIDSLNKNRLVPSPDPVDEGKEHVPWYSMDYQAKGWRPIAVPGYWQDQGLKDLEGVVWYRKEIDVPASLSGKQAKLYLGRIVDADETYINGTKVGGTGYQYPQRRYQVPAGVLKPGRNLVVVRITNRFGKGGFVTDKPYYLVADQDTISLLGYWQYKVGAVFEPQKEFIGSGFQTTYAPAALYNAMVAPEINYAIKGFLWYQGESNTGNPSNYKALQKALIEDWRDKWQQDNLPFLFVQLPGFMDYSYLPTESNWALLREAQLQSLSIPNTGMAVTIDLGEWNDVHPDRKKPVGDRLALVAAKKAYGEDVVYSGPLYQFSKIQEDSLVISFDHTGSGLIFRENDDSSLKAPFRGDVGSGFTIAGSDGRFVRGKAKIRNNQVVVWSDEVKNPKKVRYNWADSPVYPILYNREKLPASPFQTE